MVFQHLKKVKVQNVVFQHRENDEELLATVFQQREENERLLIMVFQQQKGESRNKCWTELFRQ
jgi:hypothetical protein